MRRRDVFRILDANLNRSREGLRVCEEIARFVLGDASLTRALKRARHGVSDALRRMPLSAAELLASRDVRGDVGKKPDRLESRRRGALGLFLANAQRTKESLRVLEETSKIFGPRFPARFKKTRFNVYAIEKKAVPKLEALSRHRS